MNTEVLKYPQSITVDDLQALSESLDWDDFKSTADGHIHVCIPGPPPLELVRFAYRIGKHFKRPMEAIMAKGYFVRMQAAPEYEHAELARLDPENVDSCLYMNFDPTTQHWQRSWKPLSPIQQSPGWAQSVAAFPTTVFTGAGTVAYPPPPVPPIPIGSTLLGQSPYQNVCTSQAQLSAHDAYQQALGQQNSGLWSGMFGTISSGMQSLFGTGGTRSNA